MLLYFDLNALHSTLCRLIGIQTPDQMAVLAQCSLTILGIMVRGRDLSPVTQSELK